jgi:hypothetical protein
MFPLQKQRELEVSIRMARTHNILANETVKALAYLTVEIKRYVSIYTIKNAHMCNKFNSSGGLYAHAW